MTSNETLRVLLVGADSQDREILTHLLEDRGHQVLASSRQEEGWDLFQSHRPLLVILAWPLAGTDGLEICHRIRTAPGGKECFILVITARHSPHDLREVLAAGADDFLAKPVDRGLLEIRLALAEEGVRRLRERAGFEEALSGRNTELLTLHRISEVTRSSLELEAAFQEILEELASSTGFPIAFLERFDPATEHLVLVAGTGFPLPLDGPLLTPLAETLSGLAVERGQPVAVEGISDHPRCRNEFLRGLGLRSYLAFPLVSGGRVHGVLSLADPRVRDLPPRLLRWGESLANSVASFIERVEAEEALREGEKEALALADELRRANQELEAFAYSVSHDLRAPLRTMQGFAHTLLREHGDALPPQARDFIRRILESGRQSEALIRDLLAYSRLSLEALELQEVDLNQVLKDARELVEGDLAESRAVLRLDGKLPAVLGHHATLVQAVANLLSNAVKFVGPGRIPEVRIWWEEPDTGQRARLWVEDNGIGIPWEQQERIFGVFERLEAEGSRPGTGIGLAIVRRGMERMGGRVGVVSEPGEGSRFWLELPRAKRRKLRPRGPLRWRGKDA